MKEYYTTPYSTYTDSAELFNPNITERKKKSETIFLGIKPV